MLARGLLCAVFMASLVVLVVFGAGTLSRDIHATRVMFAADEVAAASALGEDISSVQARLSSLVDKDPDYIQVLPFRVTALVGRLAGEEASQVFASQVAAASAQLLGMTPSDPAAWFDYALALEGEDNKLKSKAAFRMSIYYGEREQPLLLPRVLYCVRAVDWPPQDLRQVCESQTDLLYEMTPRSFRGIEGIS